MSFVLEQRLKTVEERVDAYLQILNLPIRASLDGTETYPLTLPDGTEHQTTLAAMFSDKYLVVSADLDLSIQHRNMILYVDTNNVTITIPENIGWNLGHKVYIIANATGFSLASSGATVLNSPQAFQDVEDSTFKVVYNGSNEYNAVQLGAATGGGGSTPAEQVVFSTAIKADKQYFSTGLNRVTQADHIYLTFDNTNALINNGWVFEITGGGFKIFFSNDFGISNPELLNSLNSIILEDGVIYKFVTYWTGEKVNVMIAENSEIALTQLNAPVISDAVWDNTTDVTITLTDDNLAPPSQLLRLESSISGADTYTELATAAAGSTTINGTGLSDANSYDFRIKNDGDDIFSLDSVYSNVFTLNPPGSGIVTVHDDFNDNSIDAVKWNEKAVTDGVTEETGGVLALSALGVTSTKFGLESPSAVGSVNDVIILQAKLTIPNDANQNVFFGLSTFPIDEDNIACIIRHTATYNQYRILVKDAAVNEINEDTSIASGKDVRVIYIPSTGAVSFEYWNGASWTSLGSSGNIDLGTTVGYILYANGGAAFTGVEYDDFFVSYDNYTTQYPAI